jgi:predicted phage baseplate assembly protein
MSAASLKCNDPRRRLEVRRAGLNGLDAVEVSEDQRTLTVTFLGKAPEDIGAANVRIDGGTRITGIRVTGVRLCIEDDPELDDCLLVTVDRPGDHSTYTLRLVGVEGFDPRYTSIPFSFKVGCPSDLDCADPGDCPPATPAEPEISYLAKDYASFRRLILDRLALIMPGWTERHVPDLGITLVELLAYVGDHLSYQQDAVATEAYLDTARRRISVRRHVRLVDYALHDGCNARAWVCLEVEAPVTLADGDALFVTAWDGAPPGPALVVDDLRGVPAAAYEAFEPLVGGDVELLPVHNEIRLWAWGDRECCLPAGATAATLLDAWAGPAPAEGERPRALRLRPGDVVVFEEVAGPRTGEPADADPAHRQAVRLTRVEPGVDAVCDQPIIDVAWAAEDALTFPLCLSAVAGPECRLVDPVSVARGNVVLVDHGRSRTRCGQPREPLAVPAAGEQDAGCDGVGEPRDRVPVRCPPVLTLAGHPVTQRAPFPAPGRVTVGQASRLARIPSLADERLRWLWRQASAGRVLDDGALGEVRTIFGDRALAEAGLPLPPRRGRRRPPTAEEQARALGRLLGAERKLLAKKIRWLEGLAGRARAGLVLGPDQVGEVREAWGDRYAEGLDRANPAFAGPAAEALRQDPREALPAVDLEPGTWTPRRDLLGGDGEDRHFVGELDDEGLLRLRFGDGELGKAPEPGSTLEAAYRVGTGVAGSVGAGAIARVVLCAGDPSGITAVRNPLPAEGGTEPEPLAEAKAFAPGAFRRRLRRAVTADDYAALAGLTPGVQRAAASLRWTGSWYEAEVAVDPLAGRAATDDLLERVREFLHRYRRIGHGLVVEWTVYVPLYVRLQVCVLPHHLRGHVRAGLLDALGNRLLPDGRRGFFHPDNLTFGDDVQVSRLVAAAQAVVGVESAEVLNLERLWEGDNGDRAKGFLPIGPLEIARLDNDPSFPENGRLELVVRGGR